MIRNILRVSLAGAALLLTGTVLAQLTAGANTNEIPLPRKLLATLDITRAVITADALHCQRDTAEAVVAAGGHYILTVTANQPKLRQTLKSLPWKQIPILDRNTEHGHGRTATPTLKACEISGGIGLPHALHLVQLTRTVTDRTTTGKHTETGGRCKVSSRGPSVLASLGRSERGPLCFGGSGRSLGGAPCGPGAPMLTIRALDLQARAPRPAVTRNGEVDHRAIIS